MLDIYLFYSILEGLSYVLAMGIFVEWYAIEFLRKSITVFYDPIREFFLNIRRYRC